VRGHPHHCGSHVSVQRIFAVFGCDICHLSDISHEGAPDGQKDQIRRHADSGTRLGVSNLLLHLRNKKHVANCSSYRASIAVLIRFAYLTTLSSEDFTYDAITIAILSSAEQGLAITAGNLVTLRPLFTRKFGLWSSLARDGNSGANQHPPTIGALDRAKGRAASAASDPGEVGLATFLRGYATDEESGVQMKRHSHILEQQSVDTTTDGSESSQKRNSNTWCAPVDDESESQNGLHHQSSRDTLTDIKKVMPATFLAREGRLRDSGGT
jgi:hypothetical protein